jgi:hypothetical protein
MLNSAVLFTNGNTRKVTDLAKTNTAAVTSRILKQFIARRGGKEMFLQALRQKCKITATTD